jgi:hypothetical protein
MASNWNPAVAQQRLGESTLRKNVLPIKGDDTHRWLHSPALIVTQVAYAELHRAGEVKQFQIACLIRGLNFPSNEPMLVCSAMGINAG